MSKDYEVGYAKPPRHARFKKGRSGNRKGRPKGSKNMRTIVKDILDRNVTITESGRKRNVRFLEAFVHQLAAKALNGSTRDQIALLKTMHDFAPDLLKEADLPELITVRYVLPDGKSVEDYEESHSPFDTSDNNPQASTPRTTSDDIKDEDDSWLN